MPQKAIELLEEAAELIKNYGDIEIDLLWDIGYYLYIWGDSSLGINILQRAILRLEETKSFFWDSIQKNKKLEDGVKTLIELKEFNIAEKLINLAFNHIRKLEDQKERNLDLSLCCRMLIQLGKKTYNLNLLKQADNWLHQMNEGYFYKITNETRLYILQSWIKLAEELDNVSLLEEAFHLAQKLFEGRYYHFRSQGILDCSKGFVRLGEKKKDFIQIAQAMKLSLQIQDPELRSIALLECSQGVANIGKKIAEFSLKKLEIDYLNWETHNLRKTILELRV